MADDKVSKNGVFIDTRTGKVVESAPEEGVQLVRPGGVLTADKQKLIDETKTALAGGDGGDKTVTTKATKSS